MADIKKKLAGNVDGDFFVDSTCDNFDICRQIAPETFIEWEDYAVVGSQPQRPDERQRALWALLACPKGAIGTAERAAIKDVFADFPLPVEDDVFYCGFNTIKSAGANSYFIKHKDGNWLISTPKFHASLVEQFERLGGIEYIFLSHRDDLGEAAAFAARFGSKTIIHRLEVDARPQAEVVLDGFEPTDFSGEFRIVPTPGHTEGHCMLLYKDKFLFSGDSLRFNRKQELIETWSPLWTWYDYSEQARSVRRLADYSFEWMLTSHGQRVRFDRETMKSQILAAAELALANPCPDPLTQDKLKNLEYYIAELKKFDQTGYAQKVESRAARIRQFLEKRGPEGSSGNRGKNTL